MYFFDTEIYYHKESPGFLCEFQGSIVSSLCIAQVTVLALIGIMMKNVFNNPEEIETYSKTNNILIIIFGWVLPIGLFTFSMIQGGNEVDYSGYCRPVKNNVMIIVIFLFSIFAYVLFFYSVISLGNTIKSFFKEGGDEKEGRRFLNRLRRYNLLLVAAVIKWLSDLGLYLLANTAQISSGSSLRVYTCCQKLLEIVLIPVYSLTFTLNTTRTEQIMNMLLCKEGEEVVWKKEYAATKEETVKVTEFQEERSSKLIG